MYYINRNTYCNSCLTLVPYHIDLPTTFSLLSFLFLLVVSLLFDSREVIAPYDDNSTTKEKRYYSSILCLFEEQNSGDASVSSG